MAWAELAAQCLLVRIVELHVVAVRHNLLVALISWIPGRRIEQALPCGYRA